MKWEVKNPNTDGTPLGRKCTRCSEEGKKHVCNCSTGDSCTAEKCKCALDGKCCKCCCTSCTKCKKECTCIIEDGVVGRDECNRNSYMSAYPSEAFLKRISYVESIKIENPPSWKNLDYSPPDKLTNNGGTITDRRHRCAQILLGSVCLIWSGLTYMYWTGKYHENSPRWNNHILDGSGLDDGTLSQWLQALGFPRDMLNNHGPGNRWDAIIWDGIMGKLYLGFPNTSTWYGAHGHDQHANTFRDPAGMNYAGYIHTLEKGAFCSQATIFNNGTASGTTDQVTDTNINKCGALFKLYILSCAYFTGLQKKTTHSTPRNPKTIREILYWLSALPYSPAYPLILKHGKDRLTEVTKKTGDSDSSTGNETPTLAFHQTGRTAPITVHEFNLFAHFQAVTQYCPLVLIGIQGGLHSTDKTLEPAIHSLYANTECQFTYPTVSIQAYNQVVHYIRALFYQLYFLRKQCAVKVAQGGKWRECRYGKDVVSKGVISWMCLGCDPMEHDRNYRVKELKKGLDGLKTLSSGKSDDVAVKVKEVLEKIGDVVVQLGNAQEVLEGKEKDGKEVDPGKNKISEAIHKVLEVLNALENSIEKHESGLDDIRDYLYTDKTFLRAIKDLTSICTSPKCPPCHEHAKKCGKTPTPSICQTCLQPTTTGVPSPLQAFLEDRLPGFSCKEVVNNESDQPEYPLAADHLGHCNGSGQCCPLPMGFRNQFHKGSTSDSTGARLYGILYFFSNENMMQSCVYTLVRVTAALSATTPQVLGDVFGFFRGGVGNKERGEGQQTGQTCNHTGNPSTDAKNYFCGWCASGLRDVVKQIEWIPLDSTPGGQYMGTVGKALIDIKGDNGTGNTVSYSNTNTTPNNLSALTDGNHYVSPLTGELYTAVSATFGGTYLSWVLYLSDALHSGLESLASEFKQIECRGCKGQCDPNKCKKGEHGTKSDKGSTGLCTCDSIVSCTGVLPVLYRHGFSYGNPFNLEGFKQEKKDKGDYSITERSDKTTKHCHEFLESLSKVLDDKKGATQGQNITHPLTNLLSQVGKLQYDIRLPWIFVLTVAWLVAVLYLAFGAIWPLDWTHMRSHWLRGGEHQWQCMWYKVMTGRKGMELVEYFGRK